MRAEIISATSRPRPQPGVCPLYFVSCICQQPSFDHSRGKILGWRNQMEGTYRTAGRKASHWPGMLILYCSLRYKLLFSHGINARTHCYKTLIQLLSSPMNNDAHYIYLHVNCPLPKGPKRCHISLESNSILLAAERSLPNPQPVVNLRRS